LNLTFDTLRQLIFYELYGRRGPTVTFSLACAGIAKKAIDNASYFQEAKRPLAAEQRLPLL